MGMGARPELPFGYLLQLCVKDVPLRANNR